MFGILNVKGYYDDLLQLEEHLVKRGFLKMENYALLLVDTTVDGLLTKMREFVPQDVPKCLTGDRT